MLALNLSPPASRKLITLFSMPSPAPGECSDRQKRAIHSWMQLSNVEIRLLATPHDFPALNNTFNSEITVLKNTSPCGRPYVSDVFAHAKDLTATPLIAFINSDIILDKSFDTTARLLISQPRPFLATARRKEVVEHQLLPNFCKQKLISATTKPMWQYGAKAAMDLFVWHRDSAIESPPLVVGRRGWDNWLLWYATYQQWHTIDCTQVANIFHQTHGISARAYLRPATAGVMADQNLLAINSAARLLTLRDCKFTLRPDGTLRSNLGSRICTHPIVLPLWTNSIAFVRRLRITLSRFQWPRSLL